MIHEHSFYRFLVFSALFTIALTNMAHSQVLVKISYPYDHQVVVSFRAQDISGTSVDVMVGGSSPDIVLPIFTGNYEVLAGRVEDVSFAFQTIITITDVEDQSIVLDAVNFSPVFELEQTRSDYFHAFAIHETFQGKQKKSRSIRNISMGTALASAGGAAGFYFYGNNAYDNYSTTSVTTDASDYRSQVEMAKGFTIGFGALAIVGLTTGLITQFTMPKGNDSSVQLQAMSEILESKENDWPDWPEYVFNDYVQFTWRGE
jgi:hypothetical protein